MRFFVTLNEGESGFLIADCPALPGCMSPGRTEKKALANIREAIVGWVETVKEEFGCAENMRVVEVSL